MFNHMHFDPCQELGTRTGTNVDRDNMVETLKKLDFEVNVYDDLNRYEIEKTLKKACNEDHSDSDCIFVCVMSHGEQGVLYAYDREYMAKDLWCNFTANKCSTLAGKPKIFLIQACRGQELDQGTEVKPPGAQKDGCHNQGNYKIPNHADFYVAYSTIPGFVSWRNPSNGSWFIQAFCQVMQEKGSSDDLVSLMTEVSRKVATSSKNCQQIPCQTSMLTRKIIFNRK